MTTTTNSASSCKASSTPSIYPKKRYVVGQCESVLQYGRRLDKTIIVKPDLPCSVIMVHGVNDVGVYYDQVEKGLCDGLNERLKWTPLFQPGKYSVPTPESAKKLEDDPDAVFYKRNVDKNDHTPVIPFYWGYREDSEMGKKGETTTHGQDLDRYGNRLDKDFSKGGGPFINATTTLPDMWNRGSGSGPLDLGDALARDPYRPMLDGPGRMYMVLAAQRLAALVSMIRDYGADETVSIVAHSQGCMLSLLAQAFLIERGLRPADTLVLTHPPYSLIDDIPVMADFAKMFGGGSDAAMKGRYDALYGLQTMHARLQTLVNIVGRVAEARHAQPAIEELKDSGRFCGSVGTKWEPTADRDNRGKVYLYFCPEDTTVALQNVQGIGWQGVPDYQAGSGRVVPRDGQQAQSGSVLARTLPLSETREPLKELGPRFFQRVFTARKRAPVSGGTAQRLKVGAAPHDFALHIGGEDEYAHVIKGSAGFRVSTPPVQWPPHSVATPASREGIRRITGEPLNVPCDADMYANALTLKGQPRGSSDAVDPIDAAVSVTSDYGLRTDAVVLDDKRYVYVPEPSRRLWIDSPRPDLFAGKVFHVGYLAEEFGEKLNRDRTKPNQRRQIQQVFACLDNDGWTYARKFLVLFRESADEARLRHQSSTAGRSFHGAIFGSAENHKNVTAYDISIGLGKAVSDPYFYAYLCAVADWRLKRRKRRGDDRIGILKWEKFEAQHSDYYRVEPPWRKALIEANSEYYSSGILPASLPVLPDGLPGTVICETVNGMRTTRALQSADDESNS